jgi:hypothetical protein
MFFYGRRSVGQSVLLSCTRLGPMTRLLLLSDSCGCVEMGRLCCQPGGPEPHGQGGPVVPPDKVSPFRRVTRLPWLRWRYRTRVHAGGDQPHSHTVREALRLAACCSVCLGALPPGLNPVASGDGHPLERLAQPVGPSRPAPNNLPLVCKLMALLCALSVYRVTYLYCLSSLSAPPCPLSFPSLPFALLQILLLFVMIFFSSLSSYYLSYFSSIQFSSSFRLHFPCFLLHIPLALYVQFFPTPFFFLSFLIIFVLFRCI